MAYLNAQERAVEMNKRIETDMGFCWPRLITDPGPDVRDWASDERVGLLIKHLVAETNSIAIRYVGCGTYVCLASKVKGDNWTYHGRAGDIPRAVAECVVQWIDANQELLASWRHQHEARKKFYREHE